MKKHQKTKMIALLAGIMCLFFIGCHPKRITWSPDGKWAAFCNDSVLRFIDAEGKVTETTCENVFRAEWFADGKRLAIEQYKDLKSWEQIEKTISHEYQQKYIQYAQSLQSVKNQKDWETKTNLLEEMNLLDDDELNAVQLYIRDKGVSGFPKSVIESWGGIDFTYHFFRIGTWDGKVFSVGNVLWSSPERIWDMRASGKGRVVAFTSGYPEDADDEPTVSSLWVADVQSEKVVLLDQNVSLYPDWTPEGDTLFYMRSLGKESSDNPLGTLLKHHICDDDGGLLSKLPEPESLAGLVVSEFTKLRCLSDGRIIFSSLEVTLPIIGKDVPEQKQLFVLDLKRQSTITRLIPRSQLSRTHGYNFDFFEVSPDERHISIPDDNGRVSALNIATGDFVVLQAQDFGEINTVPVWRSPNELCYVDQRLAGILSDKKTRQIVLHPVSADGTWGDRRVISKKWSKQARQGVLD
jgi:hypothetical protein